jgi:hypothetical protein
MQLQSPNFTIRYTFNEAIFVPIINNSRQQYNFLHLGQLPQLFNDAMMRLVYKPPFLLTFGTNNN